MTTLVNHIIRLDTFITTTRIWNQPTSHCGYSNGDETLIVALEMYLTYKKNRESQFVFHASAMLNPECKQILPGESPDAQGMKP